MKRITFLVLILFGLLAIAPVAQASNASLKAALKPYTHRLTVDISFLANFTAPGKSHVTATLAKVSKLRADLTGAQHAAQVNQGSTTKGKKARKEVLAALSDALLALADVKACAKAVKAGHAATAKRDAGKVVKETNKAIPKFETAGTLLHLFV